MEGASNLSFLMPDFEYSSDVFQETLLTKFQDSLALFAGLLLAVFTYIAFALPSITYVPPTLQENATMGLNWTYINLTSSEDLNLSLLERGNSAIGLYTT